MSVWLKKERVYGRRFLLVCTRKMKGNPPKIILIKSFRKRLREVIAEESPGLKEIFRKVWRRHGLEEVFRNILPLASQGGEESVELVDRGKVLRARLSYENEGVRDGKMLVVRFFLTRRCVELNEFMISFS